MIRLSVPTVRKALHAKMYLPSGSRLNVPPQSHFLLSPTLLPLHGHYPISMLILLTTFTNYFSAYSFFIDIQELSLYLRTTQETHTNE